MLTDSPSFGTNSVTALGRAAAPDPLSSPPRRGKSKDVMYRGFIAKLDSLLEQSEKLNLSPVINGWDESEYSSNFSTRSVSRRGHTRHCSCTVSTLKLHEISELSEQSNHR